MRPGQRLMHTGYSKILRTIIDGTEVTWHEVMARVETTEGMTKRLLRWMNYLGLVHVSGWARRTGKRHSAWAAVYAIGAGENAPQPQWKRSSRPVKPRPLRPAGKVPVELLAFSKAVDLLRDVPTNGVSLAAETGLYPSTARSLIQSLRAEKLVFIAEHERRDNGGLGHPLYAWGVDKRDRPKPRPMTRKELDDRNNEVRAARRKQEYLLGLRVDGRIAANQARYRKAPAEQAQA